MQPLRIIQIALPEVMYSYFAIIVISFEYYRTTIIFTLALFYMTYAYLA